MGARKTASNDVANRSKAANRRAKAMNKVLWTENDLFVLFVSIFRVWELQDCIDGVLLMLGIFIN